MICTPAERDLIVAGATRLVAEGDWPKLCPLADPTECSGEHCDCPLAAPQRWVDATGPCPTCHGIPGWRPHPHPELGNIADRCLNCIDGRKREALQVECPICAKDLNHTCLGYVTFAYATVEVLPLIWAADYPPRQGNWATLFPDGVMFRVKGAPSTPTVFDPLPVPGRDWVVLLDNVELTS